MKIIWHIVFPYKHCYFKTYLPIHQDIFQIRDKVYWNRLRLLIRKKGRIFLKKAFLGNCWNKKGMQGLMKTVVRNLERNASCLEKKSFVGIAVNEWGCQNPIYTGLCDVLRSKVHPRSRITVKFAYFVYIVFIACHNLYRVYMQGYMSSITPVRGR